MKLRITAIDIQVACTQLLGSSYYLFFPASSQSLSLQPDANTEKREGLPYPGPEAFKNLGQQLWRYEGGCAPAKKQSPQAIGPSMLSGFYLTTEHIHILLHCVLHWYCKGVWPNCLHWEVAVKASPLAKWQVEVG